MQKTPTTRTRVYPLIGPYNSTSDQFAAGDKSSPIMQNLVIGPSGELYQRPGFFEIAASPFPSVAGAVEQHCCDQWVWPEKGYLIVACKYKKSGDTSWRYVLAAKNLTTGAMSGINVSTPTETGGNSDRFSFAANQYWVYVANGGEVMCWDAAVTSTYFKKAASCPSSLASHVAFIDGMIVCNQTGTNSFYYAEPDPTGYSNELVWSATGLTAEAKGDTILAIHAGWRELLIQGQQSTEVWINTGNADTVFERQDGAYVERGIGAPYSVICLDGTWYWLDESHQFVKMNGRNVEVISDPIRKEIYQALPLGQSMASALRSISCRPVQMIRKRVITLRIPQSSTVSTMFVWDEQAQTWSTWSFSVSDLHSFAQDLANDAIWALASETTGSLLFRVFERLYFTSLLLATSDGKGIGGSGPETPISSVYSTPHIDHGTGTVKRCRRLNITGNGTMVINWYDDGASVASDTVTVTLSNEAYPLFRLGTYRTRRWEIYISGTSPVLRSIEEDVEDLG